MYKIVLLLTHLIIISLVEAGDRTDATCQIDPTDLKPNQPVLVDETYSYLYPNPHTKKIALRQNQKILISCVGSTLTADNGISENNYIKASCIKDQKFKTDNRVEFTFRTIKCAKNPVSTLRFLNKNCAAGKGNLHAVGFDFGNNVFVPQYSLCFNSVLKTPIYTVNAISKHIGAGETVNCRPPFQENDIYDLDNGNKCMDMYKRTEQQKFINILLGLDEKSQQYIENKGNNYLARGHLTPKCDFLYKPQQRATFHIANTAPQWQGFNQGNWFAVERYVRNYAETKNVDLDVISGVYDILKLHAKNRERKEVYMCKNGKDYAVPVPALFWKVVYDRKHKKGVVLLGTNNVYTDVAYEICKDVSDQIGGWMVWKPKIDSAGLSYACKVSDVQSRIPYLNEFNLDVQGLLM